MFSEPPASQEMSALLWVILFILKVFGTTQLGGEQAEFDWSVKKDPDEGAPPNSARSTFKKLKTNFLKIYLDFQIRPQHFHRC